MLPGSSAFHEETREQSLARYLLLLADQNGTLQSVSGGWDEMKPATGASVFDFLDGLAAGSSSLADEMASHLLREVLAQRVPYARTDWKREDAGGACWVEVSMLAFSQQGMKGALVLLTDITVRKLAELELRNSEEQLRTMIRHEPECVKLVDGQCRVQEINPAGLKIVGAESLAQVVGRSVLDLVHPDDRAAFEQLHRKTWEGGTGQLTFRVTGIMGRQVWVETHSVPLRDPSGQVISVLSVTRDISESVQANQALKSSEARFRQAFANAAVGFAITGADGIIQHINRHYCQITGYEEAELIGKTFASITHLEDVARKLDLNQRLVEGEITDFVVEKRYLRKNGEIAWVENSVSVIRAESGMPLHLLVLCKDITAARRDQEQLCLSNVRYERQHAVLTTLMRSGLLHGADLEEAFHAITAEIGRGTCMARASIWLLGPAGEAIVCGSLYETQEERQTSGMVLSAVDFPSYFRALNENEVIAAQDACHDPRTREFTESYLKPLGITSMLDAPLNVGGVLVGVLCLEHVGPPHSWTPDEQSFAVSLANFISLVLSQHERRKIEDMLRQQASLLDTANDAILVRTLDHTIAYWNKSAEKLYGWTAGEAVGSNVFDLIYSDKALFNEKTANVIADGEWAGEIQQKNKNGDELMVQARWTLVRDAAGQPKCILAINTDITAKKQLEEQVIRSQRMESIGTLAGGIAHDLNNVLTPIMMSVDLLKLRITDPACRDTLSTISASAQRGAEMLGQVLSFAKGMDGQRVPVRVRCLLVGLARIVSDTFPKNIQLRLSEPPADWTVSGDATQLHQVLLNLCVNARDAMSAGGTLSISAEHTVIDAQYAAMNIEARTGPHVLITVKDDGSGISPEVLSKIFDPFFTTKAPGKGTGLGLSTSQAIVKSHDGFMRVESELGHGTVFQIYLPACSEEVPEPPATAPQPMQPGNQDLVLFVDDEAAVREITRQTLVAHGYRVLLASDGAEAVKLYSQQQKDIAVVFTDMVMPVMDGATTCQVILKMNPHARIIAASGVFSKVGKAKAASVGVTHFLPKPYTAETILRALHQALHGN